MLLSQIVLCLTVCLCCPSHQSVLISRQCIIVFSGPLLFQRFSLARQLFIGQDRVDLCLYPGDGILLFAHDRIQIFHINGKKHISLFHLIAHLHHKFLHPQTAKRRDRILLSRHHDTVRIHDMFHIFALDRFRRNNRKPGCIDTLRDHGTQPHSRQKYHKSRHDFFLPLILQRYLLLLQCTLHFTFILASNEPSGCLQTFGKCPNRLKFSNPSTADC